MITPRWTTCSLHPTQADFWRSTATVNAVPACRRSWKTEGAKRRLVRAAMSLSPLTDRRFYALGPTQQQSRDIFLSDLVTMVPRWALRTGDPDKDIRLSDLSIHLRNGSIIRVCGVDRPSRVEGGFLDGAILDEMADCPPEVFEQHLLPMMVRPGSYIDIVGSPNGRNHWFQLIEKIKAGELGDAAHFTWTGEETLHLYLGRERADAVLAQARATMPEDLYAQEWQGAFTVLRNHAYYSFSTELHAAEPLEIDPKLPLILSFDFNTAPGVCCIMQEQFYQGDNPQVDRDKTVTCVIDEVHIPRNSTTPRVCRAVLDRYLGHDADVFVFADASGAAKGSARVDGSDIDLLQKYLATFDERPYFRQRLKMRVGRRNPPVRSRLNAVCARLLAADNRVRLLVDPDKCPNLVRDFEGVQLTKDGDIDKSDLQLTHLSDACGYYIAERWPLNTKRAIVEQL